MTKIVLSHLANLQNENTAVATLNANSDTVVTAFDNTLSRDGTTPNQMMNNLDMNSNQIINLPSPGSATSPARLQDVTTSTIISSVPPVGTSGAVVGFLNGNNTQSGNQVFSGANSVTGVMTFANNKLVGTNAILNGETIVTGGSGTITIPAATDTLVGKATTDILTNKTLDTAGTGNVIKFGGVTSSTVTGTGAVTLATSPTLVTPNIGVATGTSLTTTGVLKSSGATSGIGYATGAGGTVTQLTSKTTAVTLNTMAGQITMIAAGAIAAGLNNANTFTLNNSNITTNDFVLLQHTSGGTASDYVVWADGLAAGSCKINVGNVTAAGLTEAPVISFLIIKGVIS